MQWALGFRCTWGTRCSLAQSEPNSCASCCRFCVAASRMLYTWSSSHCRHCRPSCSCDCKGLGCQYIQRSSQQKAHGIVDGG
jgi:hypothetical protein